MPADALLPAGDRPQRHCRRCGRPVPRGRLFEGYGIDCATRLGLLPGTARVHAGTQDGPDLFHQLDEGDDQCADSNSPAVPT